ncbi:hypothetical protein DB32_002165 [Sandaracinus amylolyticus]|uniref:Uncharacterized protein n=1 Tax=Sandaracinus amylolyticus TaxID=927083 RepID=A0A0F6YGS3_9BACT|nr:hypothetical protein DB32_002165 [Sandaracinus amylolyticus]
MVGRGGRRAGSAAGRHGRARSSTGDRLLNACSLTVCCQDCRGWWEHVWSPSTSSC